jgi:NADH-quinone oxidoreductase subunit N
MFINFQEFFNVIPIIIIAAGIVLSLLIEMYSKKGETILPWFSVLMFLAAGLHSIYYTKDVSIILQGMLATGGNVNIFHAIFTLGAAVVTLLSIDYIKKYGAYFGEYYIILQTSVLGMMLMAAAKDLFVIFLGLEIMSVSFYILAGMNRKKAGANEASLKYFLLGAFATGFIVYGIALIYGSAQTTSINFITSNFAELTESLLFIAGVLLFLIGFSFKIAAFPFHMWVPDVYEGSPTTVAALFSTGGKAAAFSAIIATLFALFNGPTGNLFTPYLAVISVLSMFYGSIVAIAQTNIKRMLAYSSISHAGYLAIGLAAGNHDAVAGVIFYLAAYTFMNLGAFGIISLLEGKDETNLDINSYAGLGNKKPLLAGLLAVLMFALAGLPPFGGFFGKYYIFVAAIKSHLTWLAILGVLSSAISVYFYLRIVVLMYFKPSENDFAIETNNNAIIAIVFSFLLVILLGIFPGTLIDLVTKYV